MREKQKHDKDCLQTCLSNLLNIPYNEIPEFYKYYDDDNFTKEFDNWLSKKGLLRILIDVKIENGTVRMPFYHSGDEFECIGILRKEGRKFSHAVIIHYKNKSLEIFDPKAGSEYLPEDLIQLEFIYRLHKKLTWSRRHK